MDDPLKTYRAKRNFKVTSEPAGGGQANADALAFVIQKHWASRLHYDLRLEVDGTMKSWAVPKGPSFDPSDKRMAVQVEDHPIAYNQFEGVIPKGEYGAGNVIIWDEGTWAPVGDARLGLAKGHLKFDVRGYKLKGRWALVRLKNSTERQPAWLLIKDRDEFAQKKATYDVVEAMPDSVVPLRAVRRRQQVETSANAEPHAADDVAVSAPELPGTAIAKLPEKLAPQLATLVDRPPPNPDDWIYEIKFDGYRILARLDGEKARLFTRNGHDWTTKLPHLAAALSTLKVGPTWVDGEIVVLGDDGSPDFNALQNAFDNARTSDIVYFAFDAPMLAGRDLRGEPLYVRRGLLKQAIELANSDVIRFSEAFDVPPSDLMTSACELGLEGVMAKQRESQYVSRRSPAWVKLKCTKRQEFIVVGYTAPKGARTGLGALLLAVHDDDGELMYVGDVGSGFNDRTLAVVSARLRAAVQDGPSLKVPADAAKRATWVTPSIVAEVSFSAWTTAGRIRHSVFRGLRSDKLVQEIVREKASAPPASKATNVESIKATKSSNAKLTNADRVIDPTTGLTKLDLVRYYGAAAELLLPHLRGRPVSFLRAPKGIQGQTFFQKHLEHAMPGTKALPTSLHPDHLALVEVATLEGIMSAAQMNVIEFHTWNAVKDSISKPDRMAFDLDPGEGVPWTTVQQAAQLVQAMLSELNLECLLKTSGGKGLHVVVPIRRQHDWDTVKSLSRSIVVHLAKTIPQIFVSKSGPSNRVGKVFVDYLRNGFGATTASAWSARARPGLGVSVPIAWDELADVSSGAHWNVVNVLERIKTGNGPWTTKPQSIVHAIAWMKRVDSK